MVLLAHQGLTPYQIAPLVLRSHDTVTRVLHRFLQGGCDAVPRRKAPGPARQVTSAWEAELLRVIDLDPHSLGVPTANWTTQLLAQYLTQKTGVAVGLETVRTALHALGYVCKRPTWTLQRKAEEQPGYRGNA
jgi:transposase